MISYKQWQWKEGIVNTAHEHIRLYHGEFDSTARLVALVAPPQKNCFTVQFLMSKESSDSEISKQVLEDVKKDIDFYLIEHPRDDTDDPWQYCIYHTNTAANMYGKVHWAYYP